MDRRELIIRLERIRTKLGAPMGERCPIRELITDIRVDGVLDVQCPLEIAKDLNLPRPADPPPVKVVSGPKPTNPDRPVLRKRPAHNIKAWLRRQ